MTNGPWDDLIPESYDSENKNITQLNKDLRRIGTLSFFSHAANLLGFVGFGTLMFLLATFVHLGVAIIVGVVLSPTLAIMAATIVAINTALKMRKAKIKELIEARR